MTREVKNVAASIQARLLQRSRDLNVDHQLTLTRFGGERLLYRLAQSEFGNRFILKGAALLMVWLGESIRPTKDIDLLGLKVSSADALQQIFVALCRLDLSEDGLTFLADTIRVESIREGQEDGGMRVTLLAMLGNVRIPLQVDVGSGDAVVPPAELVDYPGLLDLPRARILAYRPETTIAEKTEAMVTLALANTRMKDLYDVRSLVMTYALDGETMRAAIGATFARRRTALPLEPPVALTHDFADDPQKRRQWDAFVRRIRGADQPELLEVVDLLREFLWPVLQAVARREPWPWHWRPGGPWVRSV